MHSEFVLGTVQCGQSYGAANITGQPSYDECARIVENAIAHGVTAIDTARGYGDSETRLGTILESGLAEQVTTITKLSPLTEVLPTATDDECKMAVDASVYRSCRELRMRHLPVLLLHRWGHRNSNDGAIWRRLLSLRAEGIIGRIGASVGSPDQALEAIRDPEVTHIQLPLNALDYRWEEAGVPDALLARPELVVHARSSLLQGLLGAAADSWPAKEAALPFIDGLERAVKMLGRRDRVELAFAFVRSYSWVTSVVVGVETMEQLADCLRKFEEPALSVEERGEVRKLLPRAPASLLDPSRWARRPP